MPFLTANYHFWMPRWGCSGCASLFPHLSPTGTLLPHRTRTLTGMTRRSLNLTAAGALLAALGVALGAFGAHAVKTRLDPALLTNFETAVRYQMYAALALLALGTQTRQRRAGRPLLLGSVIFSGSLYLMALTGARWLGAVTPVGGALMIAGFVLAALDARRR